MVVLTQYYRLFIGTVLAPLLLVAPRIAAQNVPPNENGNIHKVLQELTNEVHLLRTELVQSNARQSRIQIELERYRVAHDTVTVLSNRLEDVRTELTGLIESLPNVLQQLETAEAQLKTAAEPDRRIELEAVIKQAQASVEQSKQRESQLRQKEDRLTTALKIEEEKLQTINQRLDAIAAQLQGSIK